MWHGVNLLALLSFFAACIYTKVLLHVSKIIESRKFDPQETYSKIQAKKAISTFRIPMAIDCGKWLIKVEYR